MDELLGDFENLKISALTKSKKINSFVKNITIGPNSSVSEDDETATAYSTDLETSKTVCIHTDSPINPASVLDKFFAEIESRRQEKVQEAVNHHLNCILEFSKNQSVNSKQHLQKQQQMLITEIQKQELSILRALEQHDKDSLLQQQQLLQYHRELAEKRKQNSKELEEREKRKQKINALIDSIKKDQVEFRNIYQEIINVIKNCKFQNQLKDALGDIPKQLRTIPDNMEEIVSRCKAWKISENESRRSSELVQEIKGLLVVVQEKIAILDATQQQLEIKNVAAKPQLPKSNTTTNNISTPTMSEIKSIDVKSTQIDKFISKSSLRIYSELQDYLENYTKTYEGLVQNNSYKQFRFDCKKAVNIPVNAISAVNAQHLLDKYTRLTNLLSGKSVEAGNTRVCATNHPQGVAFCTNLLAKKFVLQGDLMISSNPEAAFCYAAIIVALWHDNSDFGKLLLAHFYKHCPYLVPFYPPRAIGQSDEEFYTSQGYQYIDGMIEKQDKFLKRMTGIMRLYAAIIIAKPKKGQQKNPYGLTEGWRWLAAFLNLQPKPDITATMLHVFFEIAGSTMQAAYGNTFQKMMAYVCDVYLPLIQKIDSGGPVTRLEVLLQRFRGQGHFEAPRGTLPTNFW